MRNVQSGSFRLGGYAGPVGNGHRGGSRKSPECFTGSAPPISVIGSIISKIPKLKKLALLSIPMAFLACQEPTDDNTQQQGSGQGSGTTVETKHDYANQIIDREFRGQVMAMTTNPNLTTAQVQSQIATSKNWALNQLANVQRFSYTSAEMSDFGKRLDTIGAEALSTFQRNNPGRSVAPSIEIPSCLK